MRLARAIALLTCLAVSGCTATASDAVERGDDIRLSSGGAAELCVPVGSASSETDVVFAAEPLDNVSDEDIRIVSVRLSKSARVRVVKALVAPPTMREVLPLVDDSWPGSGVPTSAVDGMEQIPGALIPPRGEEEPPLLVLHLAATKDARVSAVEIDYTQAGSDVVRRSQPSAVAVRMPARC
ncbi:hypothetical protein AWH69_09745 [Janibacter melonis]|uniref:Uncharacterized protein n=1 Tax=Janibacter melonis TaxID=262209 RepID=A0A176QAL2_9MICO|nr:hypothetical protein AWH69_09745 [Janibacter melonis]